MESIVKDKKSSLNEPLHLFSAMPLLCVSECRFSHSSGQIALCQYPVLLVRFLAIISNGMECFPVMMNSQRTLVYFRVVEIATSC
jgi:hypothetical protein